jgi:phospholipid/cholesterol/gamma-HCH transport system permease protein
VVGLVKSVVYGLIISVIGCLRGIQCGRSASAVGAATTSAVVTSITWIIISCAILTVVFYTLGM